MESSKECRECEEVKVLSLFVKCSGKKGDGHTNQCKDCHNTALRAKARLGTQIHLNDNFRNGLLYKAGTNLVTRVYPYGR
jgi:hypothetical protein